MGTRTDKNPAIRIYYVDPETLTPLEFDHFLLNLTAANGDPAFKSLLNITHDVIHMFTHFKCVPTELPEGETPEVQLAYNSFDEYQLEDLTPASMQDFLER